jgi:hypothetical protein
MDDIYYTIVVKLINEIKKETTMVDKVIDVIGKTTLVTIVVYAGYFYVSELIRIIS